jgi:hypothetical protein
MMRGTANGRDNRDSVITCNLRYREPSLLTSLNSVSSFCFSLTVSVVEMSISTEEVDQRSLYLSDLLPCPGPGRCDYHTALFGSYTDRGATIEQ